MMKMIVMSDLDNVVVLLETRQASGVRVEHLGYERMQSRTLLHQHCIDMAIFHQRERIHNERLTIVRAFSMCMGRMRIR